MTTPLSNLTRILASVYANKYDDGVALTQQHLKEHLDILRREKFLAKLNKALDTESLSTHVFKDQLSTDLVPNTRKTKPNK